MVCKKFINGFNFFLFFENNGPRANARPPANSDSKEKAWNERVKQLFLLRSWKRKGSAETEKMLCKCRDNMFPSLFHPYVSQSRWRLVFLTPEKYSNSHISVKDWIDIRYRIEWYNFLSSCKLLRNESYVSVEDSFIHVFHLLATCSPYTCRVQINCRSDSKDSSFVKR